MTIRKTDIDNIAQAYLRNNVNSALNPFHSGWYPAGVNTAALQVHSSDPTEATPSNRGWLSSKITGSDVRTCALNLGNYYSRIVRGAYGVYGDGSVYNYVDETYIPFSQADANAAWLNGSPQWFTMPLRIQDIFSRYIAAHINNYVTANNMRLESWVSGRRYGVNTWYNMARRNNGTVFGAVLFSNTGADNGGDFGNPTLKGIRFAWARRVNDTAYFAVKDSAQVIGGGTKAEHTARVKQAINWMGTPSGVITQWGAASLYDHAWQQIYARRDEITVDLTVCHNSSSSGAGHSSRGRR